VLSVPMDIAFSSSSDFSKTLSNALKKPPPENGQDNGDSDKGNEVYAEECNDSSEKDLGNQLNNGIDILQSYKSKPSSGDVIGRGTYESIIEEYVLQGIEEEFNGNNNEDFEYNDNVSDMNNDNMGMDNFNTLKTNEAAFGNEQPGNVDVKCKFKGWQ